VLIKSLIGTSTCIASLFVSVGLAAQPVATAAKIGGEPPVQPLAFVICAFESANAGLKCAALGGSPTYTVPSNRTFIIEQVTGFCILESTETVADVNLNVVTAGVQVDHLLLGFKPEGPGFRFRLSDDTRIYADPGSTITVGIDTGGDDRFCRLAFSGRLVR
jgi:hypothetical protein